jgi:hypothetical protein
MKNPPASVKLSGKAAQLGAAKLESSGLDPKDAKRLGFEFLSGEQTAKLHPTFKPLCSLKIKYHDHLGKPLPDMPCARPFYRVRYLEVPTDFGALSEKKPVRYVQEPNTAPVAYYPLNQDWRELVSDTAQPLIITEGELKAAKACAAGFPTIGIGGVYNWRAHRLGIEWLPSLEPVDWRRRNVYVCFDSDFATNVMVCSALKELAEELSRRGAFAYLVALPTLEGTQKMGLDDFFVSAGDAGEPMFRKLLHSAEPLGLARALFGLNDGYVYVRDPGLVVTQGTNAKTSPAAFRDHLESKTQYHEWELRKDGSLAYNAVSAAGAWLKWPLRTEAAKLTYRPGAERFVAAQGAPLYNIWTGWGVEAKRGDARPFLKLVDHLFTGAEPGAKEWFLRWCAFPLKYPGSKMFSSAVLHGIRHGTGKSFVGYTLGRIYGENFSEISAVDLHGHFNEWCEGRQFVMGDDVTGSNKRADADFLKKLITQKNIRINPKYVASYVVPDCINYFFTANHPDAFFLEDDDRRFFVHEVLVGPLPEEFYREYELWLDTGGAAAVFHHLLNLDMGDFSHTAPAFRTSAKERMIANVQSDLATWVRALVANPGHALKVGEVPIARDLFTARELLELYNPLGSGQLTANGMGRELARAGVSQVCRGMQVRLSDGSQGRYYAVRNADSWLGKGPKECAVHIEGAPDAGKGKKKY